MRFPVPSSAPPQPRYLRHLLPRLMDNGTIKVNGSPNSILLENVLLLHLPRNLRRRHGSQNPQEEVRSDLLKAIRDGIALKKVEAKNAIEDGKGQGMSDVANLARSRSGVSDSDDCASESEYDF